jgi:FkbM family methyltransferase
MNLLRTIQSLTRRLGWDLVPYNPEQHPQRRRLQLLKHHEIDMVLDVGANVGQFALELRRSGYRGHIVSFEPLATAFAELHEAARGDASWRVVRLALGAEKGSCAINRAVNVESSSFLAMLPRHLEAAPNSRYRDTEIVEIDTLDAVFDNHCSGAKRIFLKIDTQGFESQVLEGAAQSLAKIDLVQLELSLVPLYEGQALIDELRNRLEALGYSLVGLDSSFADARTGQVLQVDGVFRRGPAG